MKDDGSDGVWLMCIMYLVYLNKSWLLPLRKYSHIVPSVVAYLPSTYEPQLVSWSRWMGSSGEIQKDPKGNECDIAFFPIRFPLDPPRLVSGVSSYRNPLWQKFMISHWDRKSLATWEESPAFGLASEWWPRCGSCIIIFLLFFLRLMSAGHDAAEGPCQSKFNVFKFKAKGLLHLLGAETEKKTLEKRPPRPQKL